MATVHYDALNDSTNNESPHHTGSPNPPPHNSPPIQQHPGPPVLPPRRSTRSHSQPAWMNDYFTASVTNSGSVNSPHCTFSYASNVTNTNIKPTFQKYLDTLTNTCDPTTFSEVVKHEKWCNAMNMELQALEDNETWIITDLPPGKKAIGSKMVV